MRGNPNIAEHGWKPGESGNPNGRPKKIYTILKESGYSKDDMRDAFLELAWMNTEELKKVFENKDTPAIVKVIAHAYKKAIEKGDYKFIKDIIEQSIGTAKQSVEMNTQIDIKQITGMEIK